MEISSDTFRAVTNIKKIVPLTNSKMREGVGDSESELAEYIDPIYDGAAPIVIVGDMLDGDGFVNNNVCAAILLYESGWQAAPKYYCFVPDIICKKCNNHMKAIIKHEDLPKEEPTYKCIVCGDCYKLKKGRDGYDSLEKVE